MKVIDLLNKIANGEEVPKYIEYNGYEYCFEDSKYRDFVNGLFYEDLNNEIEIIEENPTLNDVREKYGLPRIKDNKIPEKIEYIFNLKYIDTNDKDLVIKEINKTINDLYKKYNEIIDYLEENK